MSGICDDPLIGDIVNLIIGEGDIQQLMQQGFEDNLADPDGAGPQDSALAAAIESALAGVSIAGPVGAALGGVLDAPIASVSEDTNGLTHRGRRGHLHGGRPCPARRTCPPPTP